jgi:hypothetical protein
MLATDGTSQTSQDDDASSLISHSSKMPKCCHTGRKEHWGGDFLELRVALVHQQMVNKFPCKYRKAVIADSVKYTREKKRDAAQ